MRTMKIILSRMLSLNSTYARLFLEIVRLSCRKMMVTSVPMVRSLKIYKLCSDQFNRYHYLKLRRDRESATSI
ncbi:hypothetical protein BofuT4_uP090690.1 [Botrytis cinerea T4]|uniref:Uncharacterized protein n=1 Tax=Botryotinia fuckeliana (strain T4) TaxID=999810 RepID=G2YEY9_BOTF4|nr:hypothetical protein BofuT4_uP090690.1 [Botrytis cinerea T4]